MCRKYITIFDTSWHAHNIYREDMENWDRINGRPILDVDDDNCIDLHKTQKCRMGGRVCELCDYFNIERIEYPNCDADCACKLTPALQQAIIGPDFVQKLEDLADLQFEHVKYNVIKAVRQKYPDRHVLIVEAGLQPGDYGDLVYAEVLLFKYPSLLKPIEGDHQCQCQSKELVDGDDDDIENLTTYFRGGGRWGQRVAQWGWRYDWGNDQFCSPFPSFNMIYSTRYADGTDLDRLHADLRRYEAILAVNGVQGEAGNNDGGGNHVHSDSEDDDPDEDGDFDDDDEDESSDEFDWEASRRRRREQAQEFHRLNEIDEQ